MGWGKRIQLGKSLKLSDVKIAFRLGRLSRQSGKCVIFTGYVDKDGYGHIWAEGESRLAHRVNWVLSGKMLPAQRDLHHKCRNRACINPKHLKLTDREKHARIHAVQDDIPF